MSCTVERRTAVRAAAERIGALPRTVGVDVLTPEASAHDAWTLDATLTDAPGPAVLRALGDADMRIHAVAPQAGYWRIVATR